MTANFSEVVAKLLRGKCIAHAQPKSLVKWQTRLFPIVYSDWFIYWSNRRYSPVKKQKRPRGVLEKGTFIKRTLLGPCLVPWCQLRFVLQSIYMY